MDHKATWRRGAVAGSSVTLVSVVCLLLVQEGDRKSIEDTASRQFATTVLVPAPNLPAKTSAESAIAAVVKATVPEQRPDASHVLPKALSAIQAVATQNKGVEAEVQKVIDQAESVDDEKQGITLAKTKGKVQVQGLAGAGAKPSNAKDVQSRKPKLSNETLQAMREGEQAGWAADEVAKKEAAVAAKGYYQELRKEMYKEAAKHEAKERQEILKRHSITTSEDNADLVHALDAVYRSDGPTSTRGPLLTSSAPIAQAKTKAKSSDVPARTPKAKTAPRKQVEGTSPTPTVRKIEKSSVERTAQGAQVSPALQVGPLAFLDRLFGSLSPR